MILLCIVLGTALGAPNDAGTISSVSTDGGTSADGGVVALERAESDPCAAERARIERRKSWLLERHKEQATRGWPNPKAGIPDMVAVFCEAHPADEQCTLGNPPIEFWPDELTWEAQKTPEDRDPHVIVMKRALEACRRRNR